MVPALPPRTLPDAGRAQRTGAARRPSEAGEPALCRWCQLPILARRRRTFCSAFCVHEWRLRSDPGYLREQLFLRDRGVCSLCTMDTVAAYAALLRSRGQRRGEALAMWGLRTVCSRRTLWDADHIVPVAEGGGQCGLDNLRTLCLLCHRKVTAELHRRRRTQRVATAAEAREGRTASC